MPPWMVAKASQPMMWLPAPAYGQFTIVPLDSPMYPSSTYVVAGGVAITVTVAVELSTTPQVPVTRTQ